MDMDNVYVKHEHGLDRGWVLRFIADQIVDGRIHCTGIEQRADDVYWVKDCGEYELVLPMPFDDDGTLVFDIGDRRALQFEVRRKTAKK